MSTHTEHAQAWQQIIQEAYDGRLELRKTVEKAQQSHARDAARFKLSDTYVVHMVLHDLMHTLNEYMMNVQDQMKDPRSFNLLRQVQNAKLDVKATQLKQLARLSSTP